MGGYFPGYIFQRLKVHLRDSLKVTIIMAINMLLYWLEGIAAEIFLFVLVGSTVNIGYVGESGVGMIIMLFCLISQLPKATVQAAIGGVPMAMGLSCGNVVLTMAVVSIVITAPLGALGMDATAHLYLDKN